MNKIAIIVVGTTSDYVSLLDKEHPGRCLFVTSRAERNRYPQLAPESSPEILSDLGNFENVLHEVETFINRHEVSLSGIACYDCESMNLAAFLAESLQLTYPNNQTIVNCRDKYLSKHIWQRAGIASPKTQTITSATDILKFLEEVGGPIVIKPRDGSGSELTFKCSDRSECYDAIKCISSRMANRNGDNISDEEINPDSIFESTQFIVEEYIGGREYSCDFIIDDDRLEIVRIAKKIPAPDQTFGTTLAYLIPAELPEAVSTENLVQTLETAARVLGIKRAICMVDFMVHHDNICLLEMSPRPGGDCLPYLIKRSLGIDIFDLSLDFAEKKPVVLPNVKTAGALLGLRIFAERDGIVADIDCSSLEGDPRIIEISFKYPIGHEVIMPPDDYDSRILGHIIFTPSPGGNIAEECQGLASKVKIHMEMSRWTKISA